MFKIGIMQGRLTPPTGNRIQYFPQQGWEAEFELAARAEMDYIEWIYDLEGAEANPLATDSGIQGVKELSEKTGVRVLSVCADYFMQRPLLRASTDETMQRRASLQWLMRRCQLLDMNRLVLPLVDASRIETDAEMDSMCESLDDALVVAEETGIEIHLETSLPPQRFAAMLSRLPQSMLKVNYDSGNSSSLGFDPRDEFAAYGPRIGSVHIKDRILGGGTVPLGDGDVDFDVFFQCLKNAGYSGDFVLQVARGIPGDEVKWAQRNRQFVRGFL